MRDHDVVTASDAPLIKVWFRFVPEEGFPGLDREGLWATRMSDTTARVDNVPTFAKGVAYGDVVRYVTAEDGLHYATGRVEWSGNSTVRVLPHRDGPLGPNAAAVYDHFAPFGAGGETYSEEFPLVALDIPAGADIPRVKALLEQGEADGWWWFDVIAGSAEAWA